MIRVTHAQFGVAAVIATMVHGAVLGAIALHEVPTPEKKPDTTVILDLAALGDPLGELDPQAPAADGELAASDDRPELDSTRLDEPDLPAHPPPSEVSATETEPPKELVEAPTPEPMEVAEMDPDILPESPERPDLNTIETVPPRPVDRPEPLPEQVTPIDPLPDPLSATDAPTQPELVEFIPPQALAPTMLPDRIERPTATQMLEATPDSPPPPELSERPPPEALAPTVPPDHLERPDQTQDIQTTADAPPPPELTELLPPEALVPTTLPDALERPDPTQDPLARPETVTPPPELNDLTPAPRVVEPVTPIAPPDQPMVLPDPTQPAEAPDEMVVEARPITEPAEPTPEPLRPGPTNILTDAPKLQPQVDEPNLVPLEPLTVAAVDRPIVPERTTELPELLPALTQRPEPIAEPPTVRRNENAVPDPVRAGPRPVTPPSLVTPQIMERPARRPTTQAPVAVASAATVPPSAIPRGAVSEDVRAAYANILYREINSVATRSYPPKSARRGEEGLVPVRLVVGSTGELLSVTVLDKSLAPGRLVEAALKAVKKSAPFSPFTAEMGAEAAIFEVRIHYKLP